MGAQQVDDYVPPYPVEDSLFFDYGLANEVWCKIWSHLPLESLIVVPRVCRKWRNVSLAEPQLWSTLRIASPAAQRPQEQFPDSDTELSDLDPDVYDAPQGDDDARVNGESNRKVLLDAEMAELYVPRVLHIPKISITSLGHLRRTLPLSRDLPLTLFIVVYRTVARRFFDDLNAALRAHGHRIRHLKVFLTRATFVRLIHKLQPLTGLEVLEVYSPYDRMFDDRNYDSLDWDDPDHSTRTTGRLVWRHGARMPRLQHLRTSTIFCLGDDRPSISEPFQCLRSLVLSVLCPSFMPQLLRACPVLESLRIWLEDFDSGNDLAAIDNDVYAAASRLTEVHIAGPAQTFRPVFLGLFHCPERPSYTLKYYPETLYRPQRNYKVPNILTDVHEPTYLHFTFEHPLLTVECGNDSGQSRHLSLPDDWQECERAVSLASQINPRRLRSVRCPMELYADLLGGMEPGAVDDMDIFWPMEYPYANDDMPDSDDAPAALTADFDEISLGWELEPSVDMLNAVLTTTHALREELDPEMDCSGDDRRVERSGRADVALII